MTIISVAELILEFGSGKPGGKLRNSGRLRECLDALKRSSIAGHRVLHVYVAEDEGECDLPFFGYSVNHTTESPVYPGDHTSVYRVFGVWAVLEGHAVFDDFAVYELNVDKGYKATITFCGLIKLSHPDTVTVLPRLCDV